LILIVCQSAYFISIFAVLLDIGELKSTNEQH